MPEFYNPYHFVPATGQVTDADGNTSSVGTEPFKAIEQGETAHPARHDRWSAATRSGRIICRLTLERPTIVGGEQAEDLDDPAHRPKTVAPYQRWVDVGNGKAQQWPAIPGSSLRGLVSSIAEALSQSALRVLDNTPYSFRYKPGTDGQLPLSALGYLEPAPANSGRRFNLVPLTLPTLDRLEHRCEAGSFCVPPTWQGILRGRSGDEDRRCYWREVLPAYIDGYERPGGDNDGIRRVSTSFLDRQRPDSGSCVPEQRHWWYARIRPYPRLMKEITEPLPDNLTDQDTGQPLLHLKETIDRKTGKAWGRWLLGMHLASDTEALISEEQYRELREREPRRAEFYIRGILRVLGLGLNDERAAQIPGGKKHELFIPMPADKPEKRIPVPDDVIDAFEAIAGTRFKASKGEHPFYLQGRGQQTAIKAAPYELYFFDLKPGEAVVSELSVSAVWRRGVGDRSKHRPDKPHDFFKQINRHLPPLAADPNDPQAPPQRDLTPAELLFGVVAEGKKTDELNAAALASRVRFHDALTVEKPEHAQTDITLKTLSSPKAPSPALYFTPAPNSSADPSVAISKAALNKDKHRPQGRKFYLHHPSIGLDNLNPEHWTCSSREHAHDHMRLRCKPLLPQPHNPFWFHIDFDNLSPAELTLLLASLRPDKDFRHKLGLGKSLGLGTVHIEPVALCLTDRRKRYGADALALPRYGTVHRTGAADADVLGKRWPREAAALREIAQTVSALDWAQLPDMDPSMIDHAALEVLRKLGDPAQVKQQHRVTTPLTREQWQGPSAQAEQETFAWFVANDATNHQALRPISPDADLPTLNTHAQVKQT
jgi:hypothetical protein